MPIIRRNNCVYVTLGNCYSVCMTLVCRVEFHPAYQKYLVLVILCGWLSGMQGGILPCILEVFGTSYSVWMTVWYAGWNSTLHTRSTRYFLFCVDDSGMQGGIPPCIPEVLSTCYSVLMTLVCRVEFHPAYQKYSVLVILCWWLWYAGWNSTLHTRSTRYLLFCVDDSGM